jgi:DNA-binding helix-turn-helix protein
MTSTQTVVTRLVKNYLRDSGITQRSLAAELGTTQATLSRKITGIRTWSLDDLDRLIQIGVPISLQTLTTAITEELQ